MPKKAGGSTAMGQPNLQNKLKKKASIFNQSDSDSDQSESEDWVKKSMKAKANTSSGIKKQTKIVMAQALEDDPTVFQYDEVYDKMEEKKEVANEKKKEIDRKPKYIKQLLKSAELRNKENERRIERQVQKEREAEGEMYADKETFVTGAYRAKMEEMAKEQEEEERKNRIEAALDVTRQKDLSGFYRHLYRQTHGEEKSELDDKIRKDEEQKIKQEVEDQIKKEKMDKEESEEDKARKVKEQMAKIKVEEENDETEKDDGKVIKKINRNKAIRQKTTDMDHGSDSSSSSDSSDDSSDEENIVKENLSQEDKLELRKKEMKEQKEKREARKRRIEQDEDSSDEENDGKNDQEKKSKKDQSNDDQNDVSMVDQSKSIEDAKPKIDIWKKRTVGEVLEDAIARYWKRVAERSRQG